MSGKQIAGPGDAREAFRHAIERAAASFHSDWFSTADQLKRASQVLSSAAESLNGAPRDAVDALQWATELIEHSIPHGSGTVAWTNRRDMFVASMVKLARASYAGPSWAEDDLREIGRKVALAHLGYQAALTAQPSDYGAIARDVLVSSQLVYFIGAGKAGPVKIGIAADPRARIASLQTGHYEPLTLLAVTAGGREAEVAYHARFASARLHGEWFARTPEIEAEIERLNQECA